MYAPVDSLYLFQYGRRRDRDLFNQQDFEPIHKTFLGKLWHKDRLPRKGRNTQKKMYLFKSPLYKWSGDDFKSEKKPKKRKTLYFSLFFTLFFS